MTPEASPPAAADHRSLAAALTPALAKNCDGRLGEISWFKADWQRGGAATGTSTYRVESDGERRVVLKLPVVARELTWLRRLQDDAPDSVSPHVFASGTTIGGYDLRWVVMERFDHGPLGLKWHGDHITRVAEAGARFQAGAAAYPVDQPPRVEDWPEMLERSREIVRVNPIQDAQRWANTLKTVRHRLEELVATWQGRNVAQWLHGDLHLANAMSRSSMTDGKVCLIDFAEVHAGHWVEDAVYLERQLWARPERLAVSPVKAMAKARRRLGLPVDPDDMHLAAVRRVLLAATAPAFIRSEGHPRHLAACLDQLETGLKAV
jgi:hypothetical protein